MSLMGKWKQLFSFADVIRFLSFFFLKSHFLEIRAVKERLVGLHIFGHCHPAREPSTYSITLYRSSALSPSFSRLLKHSPYRLPTEGAATPVFLKVWLQHRPQFFISTPSFIWVKHVDQPESGSLSVWNAAWLLPLRSDSSLINIYSDRRDQPRNHRWNTRQAVE